MAPGPPFTHGALADQVETWLRQQIREGRWHIGERLPGESALATELGVGRSSIREAVRLLSRDGILEVRHGAGTFVVAPDLVAADTGALLRQARLVEVYEVRRALEVEAARLAAGRSRPEDLSDVRDHLRARGDARDPASFVAVDLDFHEAVVVLSGNAVLLHLFRVARPVIQEALVARIVADGHLPDTHTAHDDLLTALERGDVPGAVRATEENLASVLAGD